MTRSSSRPWSQRVIRYALVTCGGSHQVPVWPRMPGVPRARVPSPATAVGRSPSAPTPHEEAVHVRCRSRRTNPTLARARRSRRADRRPRPPTRCRAGCVGPDRDPQPHDLAARRRRPAAGRPGQQPQRQPRREPAEDRCLRRRGRLQQRPGLPGRLRLRRQLQRLHRLRHQEPAASQAGRPARLPRLAERHHRLGQPAVPVGRLASHQRHLHQRCRDRRAVAVRRVLGGHPDLRHQQPCRPALREGRRDRLRLPHAHARAEGPGHLRLRLLLRSGHEHRPLPAAARQDLGRPGARPEPAERPGRERAGAVPRRRQPRPHGPGSHAERDRDPDRLGERDRHADRLGERNGHTDRDGQRRPPPPRPRRPPPPRPRRPPRRSRPCPDRP